MPAVIEVNHLHKRYGATVAVEDVSFAVKQGEIFGILGPNGAGKTTTVEAVVGLRRPDAGEIRVLGLDPQTHYYALIERIGIQLQQAALADRLRVWEALDLFASFYRRAQPWEPLLAQWGLASADLAHSMSQCRPAAPSWPAPHSPVGPAVPPAPDDGQGLSHAR